MDYKQAKKLLEEYYETFHPEGDYAEAMLKGLQAINDCLEMGLTGKGD